MLHFAFRCYTFSMPTTRPRHMITETNRLADGIDAAALIWPESAGERAELLRRIIEAGLEVTEKRAMEQRIQRIAAVNKAAGSLSGIWPENWREELRDEWPA